MRIPFDSLCLACVSRGLQELVGGRLQDVLQLDELTIALCIYSRKPQWVLLSASADVARIHRLAARPKAHIRLGAQGLELRRRLSGAHLVSVGQRGFDRVLDMRFSTAEGEAGLIAELMGKHSNLMLASEDGRLLAALKWVGRKHSKRPILPASFYAPPPFPPRLPVLEAKPGEELREFEGASPFLLRLIAADPGALERARVAVSTGKFEPVYCRGHGAYPIDVSALGLSCAPAKDFDLALEEHFGDLDARLRADRRRAQLKTQLERVLLAREVALDQLEQAAETASTARRLQEQAELLLAYAREIEPGSDSATLIDYNGAQVSVSLNPDLTAQENADLLFKRARKAKAGAGIAARQLEWVRAEVESLRAMLVSLEAADGSAVAQIEAEAEAHRWLHHQHAPTTDPKERPYEGHAVKELVAPGGWRVLYGENATANDYLTTRLARPNDWWLHVRAGVSAHVVIPTANKPDRVPREALEFAAQVAVRNSPSKHSSHVPVDYCLKKHVRRPKGAAAGTALYTHERTLHVDPKSP